ncbi:SMI1 / KNR4 family protein [Rosistilla ulvae]|uniref:SMI1 / KNR4 family protein n=1 Tax=Rosistilla ulvae TaxID=1930277 RepID=A0A517M3Q7_9BACT|nr:SMI1/KNR4 family protein [Rosistilla ulvae]QDS89511.1 SMI1 / KNR4 family protein [Rosistilla ulvae]
MQNILDRVAKHLADAGIVLSVELNPPATTGDIDAAQSRIGFALPPAYVEFVTQFANGLTLYWTSDDDPFGSFELEPVANSVGGALEMRDWRFYDDDAARKYGFPYTDDSDLALVTNRLMHNWIPLHAEGNGDNFSLNLNPEGFGNVLFDHHSWLDGGTGANGFLMANDFTSFFESWSTVCFAQPKSLWWKSVLTDGGVDWASDQFDDRFRLKP